MRSHNSWVSCFYIRYFIKIECIKTILIHLVVRTFALGLSKQLKGMKPVVNQMDKRSMIVNYDSTICNFTVCELLLLCRTFRRF